MSDESVVLTSRVRLARNYDDLPFSTYERIQDADACVARTSQALASSGMDAGWMLIRLADLDDLSRRQLWEEGLVSKNLLREPRTAAVLLNRSAGLSVMMNEEDHVCIQAQCRGLALEEGAMQCFHVADALEQQTPFAFDERLGYLTTSLSGTGTGMRAETLLHLPLLAAHHQMSSVQKQVREAGLSLRGVYSEECGASLYLLENRQTLGCTEAETLSAVVDMAQQLAQQEKQQWEACDAFERLRWEDRAARAWGILYHARLVDLTEFLLHWRNLRLGCRMELLPVPLEAVDQLLVQVQDAHVQAHCRQDAEQIDQNQARADMIRRSLRALSEQKA